MSVVKINVIEVPAERAELLEQRFAARAGAVEQVDGFESFDLLRPTEGTDRYLVVTKWRDEAAFEAWKNSEAFGQGHQQERSAQESEQGHGAAHGGEQGGHSGPAAAGSQLWGFEVVTSAAGQKP